MNDIKRNNDGTFVKKHGLSNTALYHTWTGIKARCYNHKNTNYRLYGARGISVCQEWRDSFECFYEWAIENGYSSGMSIDRIDNNKGYSPENCRFTTCKEQNRNKRMNVEISYNGKTQCFSAWAEELGIDDATIARRFRKGMPIEKVLNPERYHKPRRIMVTYQGKTQSVIDWSEETGLSAKLIYKRISKGYPPERILSRDMVKTGVAP